MFFLFCWLTFVSLSLSLPKAVNEAHAHGELMDDAMEAVEAGGTTFDAPLVMFEVTPQKFRTALRNGWAKLPKDERNALLALLPPGVDSADLLEQLWRGDSFHFGNPVDLFHQHLVSGIYHPQIVALRNQLPALSHAASEMVMDIQRNQAHRMSSALEALSAVEGVGTVMHSAEWIAAEVDEDFDTVDSVLAAQVAEVRFFSSPVDFKQSITNCWNSNRSDFEEIGAEKMAVQWQQQQLRDVAILLALQPSSELQLQRFRLEHLPLR